MPLPRLVPSTETVDIQETAFTTDAVGRYACSTWDEAVGNAGRPFDTVIIGAGTYGAYLAAKLAARRPDRRILLLEAGGLLVTGHIQNLGRIGLTIPPPLRPGDATEAPRAAVWHLPWRGNAGFPGQARCIGGLSNFWGGWAPRLTDADLTGWPDETRDYLAAHYTDVESEVGVVPRADFLKGPVTERIAAAVQAAAPAIPAITPVHPATGSLPECIDLATVPADQRFVQLAPLAVEAEPPTSGLFSFDKFSSVPLLLGAVHTDVERAEGDDARRMLFVVPRAHVTGLRVEGRRVRELEATVAGTPRRLPLSEKCRVVLAAGAIESTRLAMHAFRRPLMGRNLMVHLRSDFLVRVRRAATGLVDLRQNETTALLVRGQAPGGRFHLQLTASIARGEAEQLFYRMVPDLEQLDRLRSNTDPNWTTLWIRGLAETHGKPDAAVRTPWTSWIDLSDVEFDPHGVPRAVVHLEYPDDGKTWQVMDETAIALALGLGRRPADVEFFYDGLWQTTPPPLGRPFPAWHLGLGTTHHESGTLWRGTDEDTSVTDPVGKFHHLDNAYVCDQSTFPTVGSANPVLTGLTLVRQLVTALVAPAN